MAMEHKAFAFDWSAFESELLPTLGKALAENNEQEIASFLAIEWNRLRDPYDGNPLSANWKERIGPVDVQAIGDYAITKYYDPNDDFGLGSRWITLDSALGEDSRFALLGRAIGPDICPFDPGRMGSYFQSRSDVERSVSALKGLGIPELEKYCESLKRCLNLRLGVYVTF